MREDDNTLVDKGRFNGRIYSALILLYGWEYKDYIFCNFL